jgi:hypothetical protein
MTKRELAGHLHEGCVDLHEGQVTLPKEREQLLVRSVCGGVICQLVGVSQCASEAPPKVCMLKAWLLACGSTWW